MSGLEGHIKDLIKKDGPISMAHFMELCLTHPEFGYYTGHDPIGAEGDFITAPEVSQMFGELIGLFMADYWLGLGRPKPFHFIELGPGRGTLMKDALRAIEVVPGMRESVHVHFLEVSPTLKKKQAKAVPDANWVESLDEVPGGMSFIIANEFFDCLPVRQFQMTDSGWAERVIGLVDDQLEIALSEKSLPKSLPAVANIGDIKEMTPQAAFWVDTLAGRLNQRGGIALIIDYGYDAPGFGDTLQALKKHKFSSVLENPGKVDLTAHVNFENLKKRAVQNDLDVYGPKTQGEFLENIGLEHRASGLLKCATKKQEIDILSAVKRLVDPGEMGELFKVLALTKKNQPPPAGF